MVDMIPRNMANLDQPSLDSKRLIQHRFVMCFVNMNKVAKPIMDVIKNDDNATFILTLAKRVYNPRLED